MASNENPKTPEPVVPPWANYVPPGSTKESKNVVDEGWPPWANYRPAPKSEAPDVKVVPAMPAEAIEHPVKDDANPFDTHPYACCGKNWNGPRQLRMHQRGKSTCPKHPPDLKR